MTQLKGMIGIISPYKSQVRELKDRIFRLLKAFCGIANPPEFIEVNTIDSFQGREKDIIVFSCVRSNPQRQLGFVSDYRRMNVAITRAKHCLFVVGN
jgi:senataxin